MKFPKVSPGVWSVFLQAQCEWSALPGEAVCPGGWDLIEKKILQEGMGGMRPVQQVGGRAHSGCRAQTSNNSVIKSWVFIYHAGPFLQTQMFEQEGVQPSLEAVILSLKPSQIFLVCIFKLMGACCSHKEADTVLNILFVFQRPSGCISSLFEKAVTLSVLHCPKNALCWEGE